MVPVYKNNPTKKDTKQRKIENYFLVQNILKIGTTDTHENILLSIKRTSSTINHAGFKNHKCTKQIKIVPDPIV